MSDINLDELRDELAEFAEPPKKGGSSQLEERVVAGFEEIQRFVEDHDHLPRHGEGLDIFERLYAVRLERIRSSSEMSAMVEPYDHQSLLTAELPAAPTPDDLDEDALLAELEGLEGAAEITRLKHVRSSADKRAAEEIANREPCRDFARFKGLFEKVQKELSDDIRQTVKFEEHAAIEVGQWFIVEGQVAYVADMGEVFLNAQGREDARLRVVYDNATESNLLMRSLQRAMYRDPASRRILEPGYGPLFGSKPEDGDIATGTVYVLRSKSDHPDVVANRDLLHKIGVTGGDMKRRLANAKHDPTFLLADVEVVATYKLANINRAKLENLIHRIFEPARLEIQILDRFGKTVVPREWFLVPLIVIDEAIVRIQNQTITEYVYDPSVAALVRSPKRK